jgi:YD repeat-containing protein
MGANAVQFIKQPDGTYTAPAGITMTLTKPTGYKLQQRHGNTFNFHPTTRQISTVADQQGKTMTFGYTGGRLTSVTDGWSLANPVRKLTLTYTIAAGKTRLTQISDNTTPSRSVTFNYATTYSSEGDLVGLVDPEGKTSTYEYDANGHKMIKTKDATSPTSRVVVQNVYGYDGKVIQQLSQGLAAKTWNLYVTDRVGVEKNPEGGRTMYYFDEKHRLTTTKDPNGNLTSQIYDGQDHVIQKISPLNESTYFEYDADHNVTKVTDPLLKFARHYYDSLLRLDHEVDFRGHTTSYTYYDGTVNKFQVKTITSPPANNDVSLPDVVTYDYNTDGTLKTYTDQDLKEALI